MLKISIITVCYNASRTIQQCLESVQQQGVDIEHIIIDGGSTDGTLEIINRYIDNLSRVISEPDDGIYAAMNKGLKLASGDVVGMLNADDCYASKDVLTQVAACFDDPEIDACYGDLVYLDIRNENRVVRYWKAGRYAPHKFYWGWMPPHPTFFVRRTIYEKYGIFNTDLGTASDYEIMLRFILKRNIGVSYIPKVLVKMKTGGVSNLSFTNRVKANRMDRRAWQVNDLHPNFWTLWVKPLRKLGQWMSSSGE